ncbi:solute:Na+ symporter, SSS family protein [Salinisphaera shabanensis T35B1]
MLYIVAYVSLAVIGWWIVAPYISRLGRLHGFLTQAEFFVACYPTRGNVLGLFVGVVSILAMVPYLAVQIAGTGLLFEAATSGTVPFWLGSLLACGVVAAYVYASGLQGIGWTNLLQGVMMVFIAWFLGLATADQFFGGVGEMFREIQRDAPEYLTMPGAQGMGWGNFSTSILVSTLGCLMWPHIFMKFYSARNERTLKRVFILYPLYGYLLIPLIFIGFAGVIVLADQPLDSPHEVLPKLVVEIANFSPWLIGLALSGALAAAMSTAANLAHTSATILTRDIGQNLPLGRNLEEAQVLKLTRAGVVVVSLAAYVLALFNPRLVGFAFTRGLRCGGATVAHVAGGAVLAAVLARRGVLRSCGRCGHYLVLPVCRRCPVRLASRILWSGRQHDCLNRRESGVERRAREIACRIVELVASKGTLSDQVGRFRPWARACIFARKNGPKRNTGQIV